jgi:hypothetical protein
MHGRRQRSVELFTAQQYAELQMQQGAGGGEGDGSFGDHPFHGTVDLSATQVAMGIGNVDPDADVDDDVAQAFALKLQQRRAERLAREQREARMAASNRAQRTLLSPVQASPSKRGSGQVSFFRATA